MLDFKTHHHIFTILSHEDRNQLVVLVLNRTIIIVVSATSTAPSSLLFHSLIVTIIEIVLWVKFLIYLLSFVNYGPNYTMMKEYEVIQLHPAASEQG